MDVWRQWIKHRSASINEYSTRYSVAIDASQTTPRPSGDPSRRKTAREAGLTYPLRLVTSSQKPNWTFSVSHERFTSGALSWTLRASRPRKDLPLSTYTEAYWKIDLHNSLHFLGLRMDKHAQQEICAYAETIGREVVARWTPMAWEAFLDYRLNAVQLSSVEARIMSALVSGDAEAAISIASERGLLRRRENGVLRAGRELTELEDKLKLFGVAVLW